MYKQIYDFLKEIQSNPKFRQISFGLVNKERVIYKQQSEPYMDGLPRIMFSLTKSFTSIAIGILYDRGLIKLEDKAISFFDKELPEEISLNLSMLTVKDLLAMGSGLKEENFRDALVDHDFVEAFFKRDFVYKPGTRFLYSTRTSHILSAIVKQITGMLLHEFLEINLFSKIGINNYTWEITPENNSYGGSGLGLTHDDLSKLGMLLANEGKFGNVQIVSKAYLDLATSHQITKQDSVGTEASKSRGIGYGFQFHIVNENEYAADGAFGQVVYVFKKTGLAVILTSQDTDFPEVYRLIQVHFRDVQFTDEMSEGTLKQYTDTLSYVVAKHERNFKENFSIELDSNSYEINKVTFKDNELILNHQEKEVIIDITKNTGIFYGIKTFSFDNQKYYLNILEDTKSKIVLSFIHLESPFVTEIKIEKVNDELIFSIEPKSTFYQSNFKQVFKLN